MMKDKVHLPCHSSLRWLWQWFGQLFKGPSKFSRKLSYKERFSSLDNSSNFVLITIDYIIYKELLIYNL